MQYYPYLNQSLNTTTSVPDFFGAGGEFWTILKNGTGIVFDSWGKIIDLQNKSTYGDILLNQTPYVQNVAGQTVNYNFIIVSGIIILAVILIFKK